MIDLEMIWFIVFGALAVASAIKAVTSRDIMHSALFFGLMLLCVALVYISLNAEFIAAVQVLIYMGAIIVLILFVIMLTGGVEETLRDTTKTSWMIPVALSLLFILLLANSLNVITGEYTPEAWTLGIRDIGVSMLNEHLFPFEVISLVLLVAMAGTIFVIKGGWMK